MLLTDVVDSTALAERLGDAAMARVWAAHDRGARDLLPAWRGREIDKSDGMLLLFEAVDDAVGFALAYQRMLSTLPTPLSARAGIHRAAIVLRRNSAADVDRGAKPLEVEGAGKAMAARIMALANGGQTLLSEHARAGLQQAALRVQSHGHWRMKGFVDRLEVFQVGDEATSFVPPADGSKAYRVVHLEREDRWAPVREIRHSLPAERDSFVGRSATLLELARRFDDGARLVTVLAMGGMGKTRLVERFGWSWLGDFPGGVWFCDLSVAASLDGIANAVAQGLGVPLANEQPIAQIGQAIAGRGKCLVILDNFEQVTQHAQATLGRWMAAAAQAQFIVTTRESLGLAGEETLILAPLDAADAQRLFLQRARAANPGFKPGVEDDAAIQRLVELLDALPLAIELAAARVNVIPPAALLARLSNRFALLASTARGRGRQATLRGVFDWSWELLEAPEKTALAQLSMFESGFDLAAAEAVLQLGDDGPMVMDVLQSLVQKSFVRSVASDRFDLLVSVKEYAAQHLAAAGRFPDSGPGMQRATEARHFLHYAAVRRRDAGKRGKADTDNFVAACRRASAHGNTPAASRALENAWEHIQLRGPFAAVFDLASAVMHAPRLAAADRARVGCVTASAFAALGKNGDANRSFDAALQDAREAGDAECECRALAGLGLSSAHLGRSQASLESLASALAIAARVQDGTLEAEVRNSYATAKFFAGQPDASGSEFVAALALARREGEVHLESRILANLGVVCIESGRMADARSHYEQALLAARSSGNRTLQATVMCNLGLVHHVQGSLAQALELLGDALAELVDIGNRRVQGAALCNLGMVCERLARTGEARGYLDEGLRIARELGDTRLEGQILGSLGLLLAGNGEATAAREHLARADALLRSLADKTSLGIVLCARAEAEQRAGDGDAAVRALAEAEGFARELSLQDESEFGVALLRARKAMGSAAQ